MKNTYQETAEEKRAAIAAETLEILSNEMYTCDNKLIDISLDINESARRSRLYRPEDFVDVQKQVNEKLKTLNNLGIISVDNVGVVQAMHNMELSVAVPSIGVLNFASAKNPGGGFIKGRQAQEECIARATSLYHKMPIYGAEMYSYNRKLGHTMYSDYMLYTPDAVVFRKDTDELYRVPFKVDILTSAAVNLNPYHKDKVSYDQKEVDKIMMERLDKILGLFVLNEKTDLILGAWGCGVFENDPNIVAGYFKHFLGAGGKYNKAFDHIDFAVQDSSQSQKNFKAFDSIL